MQAVARLLKLHLVALVLVGCGDSRRSERTREPTPLVIPPLGLAATPSSQPAFPERDAVEIGDRDVPNRDPRFIARRPRSRALMLSELQSLNRVLDTTQKPDDRAAIHRRLAELHSELEHTSSGEEAARSRDEAIKHYEAIKAHPASYNALDEVSYYLGLAYERAGDFPGARATYFSVVTGFPSSGFVPLVYFSFGEIFFTEAKTDPSKLELAQQAYVEARKYPPPANKIYFDALLRIGEIALQRGDEAKARATFEQIRREAKDSWAAGHIPEGF